SVHTVVKDAVMLMSFWRTLSARAFRTTGVSSRRSRLARPRRAVLEPLEDRTLLTIYTVTALTDPSSGTGSGSGTSGDLRYCITQANGHAGTDTIQIPSTLTGTISMAQGAYTLNGSVNINVLGASNVTIDAKGAHQIFLVNSGFTVNISGLTLKNGKVATTT